MKSLCALAPALALATILSPARARAEEPLEISGDPRSLLGFALSFDLYQLRRPEAARAPWADVQQNAGGLALAYDLWRPGEETRLALAAGWMSEQAGPDPSRPSVAVGRGVQTNAISLRTQLWHLGAALRWRTAHLLQPYLALGGGVTDSKLSMDSYYLLSARARGVVGRASLGLRLQPDLLTVKRAGSPLFGFALAAEIGAQAGTSLRYSFEGVRVAPPAEKQPIAVQSVPAGDLTQTAAYGRLSLMAVF